MGKLETTISPFGKVSKKNSLYVDEVFWGRKKNLEQEKRKKNPFQTLPTKPDPPVTLSLNLRKTGKERLLNQLNRGNV